MEGGAERRRQTPVGSERRRKPSGSGRLEAAQWPEAAEERAGEGNPFLCPKKSFSLKNFKNSVKQKLVLRTEIIG